MNQKIRVQRFSLLQRLFHLLLILMFLIQGSTGLARMFTERPWGQTLASIFGGYEFCRTIHIYVGIIMLVCFGLHCLYLLFNINWRNLPGSLFGPDSLVPRPKDIKDFFQHIGWFFGFAQPPQIDRWGYWEKFDYWAVFWGIPVLGTTGLLLAYPLAASRIIPGWGLNLAFWVHRIEALLAMCHVFIIHFFIGHLRRHNFPMDRTMFEGSTDLEKTRHERPAWVTRLETTGKINDVLVPEAGIKRRVVYYIIGYLALASGIFLLIGGIVNSPYITW